MSSGEQLKRAHLRRVVVLGSAFDPIHSGHVALAVSAALMLEADEAWLIPNGTQPWKGPHHISDQDRWDMVVSAAKSDVVLRPIGVELFWDAPLLGADTARLLTSIAPNTEFWWIFGADAARAIPEWDGGDEFLGHARIAVVERHGVPSLTTAELDAIGAAEGRAVALQLPIPDVSSSLVRRLRVAGRSIAGLVPATVADLITSRNLYAGPGAEGIGS